MRRLILATLALSACATMAPPPGGPEDKNPPRLLSRTPAPGASDSTAKEVTLLFDEVIMDPPRSGGGGGSGLSQFVLLSPDPGNVAVEWHRERVTIRPERGLRANTTYRITLLPGISDLRGHSIKDPVTWTFTTGAVALQQSISGVIFDWASEQPAALALVQATSKASATDSLVYSAVADSTGRFSVGPLSYGTYQLRGFIDANGNRRRDSTEKWSGTITAQVSGADQAWELLAIERDSVPPDISNIEILDSVSVRVHFDRPLDPQQPLQPSLFRVQRTDSTELQIAQVVPEKQDLQRREAIALAVADSLNRARADSIAKANPGAPVTAPTVTPTAPPAPAGPAPLKPTAAPPISTVVIYLTPAGKIAPDEIVRITARGLRGILGASKTTTTTAKRPK